VYFNGKKMIRSDDPEVPGIGESGHHVRNESPASAADRQGVPGEQQQHNSSISMTRGVSDRTGTRKSSPSVQMNQFPKQESPDPDC
jgi:hypothetical protein